MAIYSIHNRQGAGPEEAIFVREGFSTCAFLFTVLWALWHRLWLVAAILLAITAAIALAGSYLGASEFLVELVSLAVNLIFGFEARDLQARALVAAGCPEIGLSHGRNLDEAETRFFHQLDHGPASSAVPTLANPIARPYVPDTLGLFGNV